jgi:hypothetical protein
MVDRQTAAGTAVVSFEASPKIGKATATIFFIYYTYVQLESSGGRRFNPSIRLPLRKFASCSSLDIRKLPFENRSQISHQYLCGCKENSSSQVHPKFEMRSVLFVRSHNCIHTQVHPPRLRGPRNSSHQRAISTRSPSYEAESNTGSHTNVHAG